MTANQALLLAAVAALLGPLVAYVTASRKLSGKIGTSDASRLWEASEKMRDDCYERLAIADARISELYARLGTLESENHALRDQVAALQKSLGRETS